MNVVFGYETFEKEMNQLNKNNTFYHSRKKGIEGEIKVADCLNKIASEELLVVYHPKLTNFEPDVLLCSSIPEIGFKIIEIKNWSISNIKKVNVNGVFAFQNRRKKSNPGRQAQFHVDDARIVLENELNIRNVFIDYMVVFPSISKKKFHKKFLIDWDDKAKQQFYKRFLFKEDIQSENRLLKKIKNSKKMKNIKGQFVSPSLLYQFAENISIGSSFEKYDVEDIIQENDSLKGEINDKDNQIQNLISSKQVIEDKLKDESEKVIELKYKIYKANDDEEKQLLIDKIKDKETLLKEKKEELILMNKRIDKLNESQEELIRMLQEQNTKRKKENVRMSSILFSSFVMITLFIIFGIGFLNHNSPDDIPVNTITIPVEKIEVPTTDEKTKELNNILSVLQHGEVDDPIDLTLLFTNLSYDPESGTKFTRVRDNTGSIEAILFEDVLTSEIEVGMIYEIKGYIDFYYGTKVIVITEIT